MRFILCVIVLLSFFFIKTTSYASPTPINLTLVDERISVPKSAFCLNGTLPGYYFDKGYEDGVSNWLVNLQGGAWCNTTEDCLNRAKYSLGGTSNKKTMNFTGILDKEKINNPHFYNWNRVYVRYCDGASFMGDVEGKDPVTKLYFRGASIFDAVMEDLLGKGMKNASNAMLTGCSAGGLATILHCDGFRGLFNFSATRVKCIADGGFFIRAKELPGAKFREEEFGRIVELHGLAKTLPSSCTRRADPRLCLFPEYLVGDVQTPLFLLNSAFDSYQISERLIPSLVDQPGWDNCTRNGGNFSLCTASQIQLIKDFKTAFLQAIDEIGFSPTRGILINSCYLHCHTENGTIWGNFRTLENLSLAKVIGDWFSYDGNFFIEIDTSPTPRQCKNI